MILLGFDSQSRRIKYQSMIEHTDNCHEKINNFLNIKQTIAQCIVEIKITEMCMLVRYE